MKEKFYKFSDKKAIERLKSNALKSNPDTNKEWKSSYKPIKKIPKKNTNEFFEELYQKTLNTSNFIHLKTRQMGNNYYFGNIRFMELYDRMFKFKEKIYDETGFFKHRKLKERHENREIKQNNFIKYSRYRL